MRFEWAVQGARKSGHPGPQLVVLRRAAELAKAAGPEVVMDRCILEDHRRLACDK